MTSEAATGDELREAPAPPRQDPTPETVGEALDAQAVRGLDGSHLVRATQLTGRPVVTLDGDREVEVKDVVFDRERGGLTGFTLRSPGLLGGPRQHVLTIGDVVVIGPDAVMIPSHRVFVDPAVLAGTGDNVLGDTVFTDEGTDLGTVADVIVSVKGGEADIVGFEVEATEALSSDGGRVLIPLPVATAISAEAIVVPASSASYSGAAFIDFGASVDAFRANLEAT